MLRRERVWQAVLVHQLSKLLTQNPFRKNKGRVVTVEFHPVKPFFFVATQNHVRVYNLARQALAKKLVSGSGIIASLAVHPSGDHVIVGTQVGLAPWQLTPGSHMHWLTEHQPPHGCTAMGLGFWDDVDQSPAVHDRS